MIVVVVFAVPIKQGKSPVVKSSTGQIAPFVALTVYVLPRTKVAPRLSVKPAPSAKTAYPFVDAGVKNMPDAAAVAADTFASAW
jgi:hypothetical protein